MFQADRVTGLAGSPLLPALEVDGSVRNSDSEALAALQVGPVSPALPGALRDSECAADSSLLSPRPGHSGTRRAQATRALVVHLVLPCAGSAVGARASLHHKALRQRPACWLVAPSGGRCGP